MTFRYGIGIAPRNMSLLSQTITLTPAPWTKFFPQAAKTVLKLGVSWDLENLGKITENLEL